MFRRTNEINEMKRAEDVQNMQMKIRELMQIHPQGLSLPEFERYFWSMYSPYELQEMGFSSLESCLESMPSMIYLKPIMGETYVFRTVTKGVVSPRVASMTKYIDDHFSCTETISTEYLSVLDYRESNEHLIPEEILENLRKVAERYPYGIRASAFPTAYEAVTGEYLDLDALGYDCLFSLIWDVPHIFTKKEAVEISNDWYVVPSKEGVGVSARNAEVEEFIWKIRKLLRLNPDGIRISEFLETYFMNFLEPLDYLKVGYDSVESFLMSVAREVPFRFITSAQQSGKVVQLISTQARRCLRSQPVLLVEVPLDIVQPGTPIPPVELPADLNFTVYYQVYVTQVNDPGDFYISLIGPNYKTKLNSVEHVLHEFYQSKEGVKYMMVNQDHIRVGTVCAALFWDMFWYRAKITSVISTELVEVTYIDYGGKRKLPIASLRYLKKEFSELPSQALPSTLACVKPANNQRTWDMRASNLMLNIIYDKPMMAKFDSISENGKLSLVICDTNGEEEVFINDKLLEAGFAEPFFQQASLNQTQVLQTQLMQAIAKPETSAPIVRASRGLQVEHSSVPPTGEEQSPEVAPPVDESEVFDDDLFDEFYQRTMSIKQRFVKRSVTADKFNFHVIDVKGELHVSCADLAALFWNNKDEDYLFRRLQSKKYDLPMTKIFADLNPDMFYQIKKFQVKGVKGFDEKAELLVFPLKKMIEVLDVMGHPSEHLRNEVQLELKSFSYSNPVWMEFHEDVPDLEPISFSEEEKLERLCLGDLLATKERVSRKLSRNPSSAEGRRLRTIMSKIVDRILLVLEICEQSRSRS